MATLMTLCCVGVKRWNLKQSYFTMTARPVRQRSRIHYTLVCSTRSGMDGCLSSVYLSQAFPIQVRKRLLFSTLSLFNLSRACLGKIGVFPQSYGSSKTALWSQERPQHRSVPRTAMIRTRSHSMSFCRRQRRLGLKSRNQLQIEAFSRS